MLIKILIIVTIFHEKLLLSIQIVRIFSNVSIVTLPCRKVNTSLRYSMIMVMSSKKKEQSATALGKYMHRNCKFHLIAQKRF